VVERERLSLDPVAEDPEVGRWLAAMQDARSRTLQELEALPADGVEWVPPGRGNSIGTLLYHVALIEADWLFEEILGGEGPAWPKDLFPFDVREVDGTLTPVRGLTMDDHLQRLEAVRELLLGQVASMSSTELHRVRALEAYDVAPDWVLHHLMQHEAEHRAQMAWLRTAATG
jgi:uncharacterized damage-inducible protein DinB